MIKIEITADSTEELQKELRQLLGNSQTVAETAPATEAPVAEPAKPAPARTRAKKEEAVIVPMNTADPLAPEAAAPIIGTDPLAATAAPSADPLGTSAPVADPLASAPAAPATTAPAATPATISLQTIREKIGTLTDKKQQCKDLIATYEKADGTPCEKPSDLQESDYAAVYEDLDYI